MTAVNNPKEKAWQDGIQLARERVAFAIQGADDPGLEPASFEEAVEGLDDEEANAFLGGLPVDDLEREKGGAVRGEGY